MLARYQEDVPHSCLRVEDNRVIFLLLTLRGDPLWCYRVDELHPRARDHRLWGKCYWCDWEPMEMSVVDLINYLRLEGPHDLESVPTASEDDAPPPGDELTEEEEDLEGVEDNPDDTNPRVEADLMGDPRREELMEEEDPEEDSSDEDPMEEEDPKEDPEVDPEEDSKVSEGQLMGSEDLMGDQEEERRDRTI